MEDLVTDYQIGPLALPDGRDIEAALVIIEWNVRTERALFLCDSDGFSLSRVAPGIQAPGFIFTAYLKSSLIRELEGAGDLHLERLHPDLRILIDSAKDKLREHFRKRSAEKAAGVIEEWKREDIYPYSGTPRSAIEEAERQVFDVLALNVSEYLPDFHESSQTNRKLSFRLLKNALETSPEAVHVILNDILELPLEKQQELVELLERTSLEAMINASKIVADRLDFLQGLEHLIFSESGKKKTLERRHLHKIVAEHTWLFGEEFNLTLSDRSLTNVLKRHLDLSEIELLDDRPVVREDGSEGIVDLMLSRIVPQTRPDQNEHLIIELKRPSVMIGNQQASQIKDYATAIVKDDRYRDTQTSWTFWAVSNEISESVKLEASQSGRPKGVLWDLKEHNLRIWVKQWGQIIEDNRARLRFFEERLEYEADEESGLEYLRKVHKKYLPEIFTEAEKEPEKTSEKELEKKSKKPESQATDNT